MKFYIMGKSVEHKTYEVLYNGEIVEHKTFALTINREYFSTVFTSDHLYIESKQCTLNTWVV